MNDRYFGSWVPTDGVYESVVHGAAARCRQFSDELGMPVFVSHMEAFFHPGRTRRDGKDEIFVVFTLSVGFGRYSFEQIAEGWKEKFPHIPVIADPA